MDKTKRDMLRVAMQMVAQNVYKLEQEAGVVGFKTHFLWPDGLYGKIVKEPGVQLTAECFLELFGDDTEYEYVAREDGDEQMQTRVNGVLYFALVN